MTRHILFHVPAPIVRHLGAAKALLEFGNALSAFGWECDYIDREKLAPSKAEFVADYKGEHESDWLKRHLLDHAAAYDVIDYDHTCLPFSRALFSPKPLFVARSQLLLHSIASSNIPIKRGLRPWIGDMLLGATRRRKLAQKVERATTTVTEADAVLVLNDDDKRVLEQIGLAPEKIAVFPNGLDARRLDALGRTPHSKSREPRVVFVGTFDPRKGSREFPRLVDAIIKHVPNATFRLLGTRGMYPNAESVFAEFPRALRSRIDVVPSFDSDALPALLADCSVGIFPSHLEGFGLGVLEMLAAGIPVIAYNVPGPPMMLPPEYLVDRGDWRNMAAKTVALLHDSAALVRATEWARTRSLDFQWPDIAARIDRDYRSRIAARHDASR